MSKSLVKMRGKHGMTVAPRVALSVSTQMDLWVISVMLVSIYASLNVTVTMACGMASLANLHHPSSRSVLVKRSRSRVLMSVFVSKAVAFGTSVGQTAPMNVWMPTARFIPLASTAQRFALSNVSVRAVNYLSLTSVLLPQSSFPSVILHLSAVRSLAGRSWAGRSWAVRSLAGRSWAGRSWAGRSLAGRSLAGRSLVANR